MMKHVLHIIDKLETTTRLEKDEMLELLSYFENEDVRQLLAKRARKVAQSVYGHEVYTRGLIEFSNYCHNDCYYCGIRKSNLDVSRYRLSQDDIME